MYLHHRDGHRVPVTVRGEAIPDASGRIVGAAEVFTPRGAARERQDARTRDDPALDPVAGITSRRFGEMTLAPLVEAVAEGTTTLRVLFLDVGRADHLMYECTSGGRKCVTADSGRLVSEAERPLVGDGPPWEAPGA